MTYVPWVMQDAESGLQALVLTPEGAPRAFAGWSLVRPFMMRDHTLVEAHNIRVNRLKLDRVS